MTTYKTEKFTRSKQSIFKVNNAKEIMSMALPIFIQLLISIFVTQINQLAMNYYQNGKYAYPVNQAIVCYFTLQFVPTLIASGTLIVCGNLIGQGKRKELSEVITTGLIINFLIMLVLFIITETFAEQIINILNKSNNVDSDKTLTITSEESLRVAVGYYRVIEVQFLMLSIIQVFISGLQSMKKSIYVTVGSIISSFVDLVIILLVLFIFDLGPVVSASSLIITGTFLIFYMGFFCIKFISKEGKFRCRFNLIFAKDTLKMGLPITLEMGTWFLFSFVTSASISKLGIADFVKDKNSDNYNPYYWLVFHRNIISIQQYSSAFTSAMGTVTSVFVARKIGEGDKRGAYFEGINCWKLAIYASVISGTIMFLMTYPILKIFAVPETIILKWGFILFGVLMVKLLFDTVNMTILRALWSCNDLYFPIILSFFTMGLGMVVGPLIVINVIPKNTSSTNLGFYLLLIYLFNMMDPIIRSIVYQRRWRKGTWQKYAKKI